MCSKFTSMERHQYSEAMCSSAFKLLPPSTSFLPTCMLAKPLLGEQPFRHFPIYSCLTFGKTTRGSLHRLIDQRCYCGTRSQKKKKCWNFSSVFGSNSWGLFQSLVMSGPGCNNNITPPIKTDQNFDIFHFHRTFPGVAIRRTELDQVISRPVKN